MKKYLIYAMENKFQGLHGIESLIVDEYDDINDVYKDASYYSEEVMQEYSDILDELEEEANELCKEQFDDNYSREQFDDVYYDLISENICYYIYQIKDEVTLSCEELENKAFHLGAELFIKEFCYPDILQ